MPGFYGPDDRNPHCGALGCNQCGAGEFGEVVEPGMSAEDVEPSPAPTTRHWLKAGIELEGAWNDLRQSSLVALVGDRGQVKGDGSVTARPSSPTGVGFAGEVASNPYRTISGLAKMVERCYPHVVNSSCGMHVHTSWEVKDYLRLARPDFLLFFAQKWRAYLRTADLTANEKVWLSNRLRGSNSYCRVNEAQDAELGIMDQGDRYRQLNFCWGRHKTLECRLLPMMESKEHAMHAVEYLLALYEEYLSTSAQLEDQDVEHPIEVDATEHETEVMEIVAACARPPTPGQTSVIYHTSWDARARTHAFAARVAALVPTT